MFVIVVTSFSNTQSEGLIKIRLQWALGFSFGPYGTQEIKAVYELVKKEESTKILLSYNLIRLLESRFNDAHLR